MATPYSEVLARNLRALRSRAGLNHADLATRMRNLGYAWHTPTVSKVERGERLLKADEIPGLAFALQTIVPNLLSPTSDDDSILFGTGTVSHKSVAAVVQGRNDQAVSWDDNVPAFGAGRRAFLVDEHPDLFPGARDHDDIVRGD